MSTSEQDKKTLRALAERYSEIAHLDIQQERIERYYKTNSLEEVRPIVLINEIPWGEIQDEALVHTCSGEARWLESQMRLALYKWDHFQVDMVIPPVLHISKHRRSTGIGMSVKETQLQGNTGTHIRSHEYSDQLKTEADLEKLQIPEITYDKESTERNAALATEVFSGLMPVKIIGSDYSYNMWDNIAMYRGVEPILMDLAMRPEFMHETAKRFMEIAAAEVKQCLEQDLLGTGNMLIHCTAAPVKDLPGPEYDGKITEKEIWGRCSAQIFGAVSPDMHDEFDLAYNEKVFGEFGLLYYGCCEPMHNKVDILRKRFKNLRKISITPWADPEVAADNIGKDFVFAAKPNPANVSMPNFNPEPVKEEIAAYLEPCKRNGTTCEFVLKDISTISNNPDTLTKWAETVNDVVDRYYE